MKLKRQKTGDRAYSLIDTETGVAVASAAQTGEHGRDNYPWEWQLLGDRVFGKLSLRAGSSVEALKDAIDIVESHTNTHGLLKPAGSVSPYDIKKGQVYRYRSYFYTATEDARGEFNAYIMSTDYKGENADEVVVAHGDTVTLYIGEYETYEKPKDVKKTPAVEVRLGNIDFHVSNDKSSFTFDMFGADDTLAAYIRTSPGQAQAFALRILQQTTYVLEDLQKPKN